MQERKHTNNPNISITKALTVHFNNIEHWLIVEVVFPKILSISSEGWFGLNLYFSRQGHLLVIENFNSLHVNHGLMEVGYVNHQALTLAKDFEQTSSVSMTATMDVQGNLILGKIWNLWSQFLVLQFFLPILSLLPERFFFFPFFHFTLCIYVYY